MINFSEVESTVRALKKQLVARQIDEEDFEKRLLDLIDVAEDGYYWMFGHQTERWFRHDGEKWLPDDPGRITAKSSQAGAPASPVAGPHTTADELPVSTGWFVISLAVILAIGWIVYASSLVFSG